MVEVESFLEADLAFKKEGSTYRLVKNKFGNKYVQGLSKDETLKLADDYASPIPVKVFYG